ncbi:MAG TPA: TlpA disulfide reductase family protein [Chitinophagales bacterium]|nr:TlpA disulfide reductase family protein [Chitinophagales bacterium]
MKKIFFLSVIFLATTLQFVFAQDKKLPAIILTDVDGNKVDLSQLNKDGKIIIMDFWATWCVPCKKELTNIMNVYAEWQKNYNVELVAVSIDDSRNTTKVKPTVDGSSWPYQVLLDPNSDLKRILGFQNVPYVLVTDKDGNIVYQHTGYVEGDEFELEDQLKKMVGK